MKKQTVTDENPEPDPKERKSLDSFNLFYEELPTGVIPEEHPSSKRLVRRSRTHMKNNK